MCNCFLTGIWFKINRMKQSILVILLLCIITMVYGNSARIITGTVTDDAGNPLITQIVVKETKVQTFSAANGTFSISIPTPKATLIFTMLGFATKWVIIGNETVLNVRMQSVNTLLSEVVVVGYQAQKRKDLTGSVSVLSGSAQPNITSVGSLNAGSFQALLSKKPGKSEIYDQTPIYQDKFRLRDGYNREGYAPIVENPYLTVSDNPLSTFSIDVDAASYSNVRRYLNTGQLPPASAVRIEEMINYFHYEYPQPVGKDPFAVHTEMAVCPWNTQHQLMMIGLQGKKIDVNELPPSNLTFLIDVSGSMFSPDKLPLVKASLQLLVDQLRPTDKVAIVAYAGNAGLVLPSTSGNRSATIKEAIERLEAGGSTAGGSGIQLAYKIAKENFEVNGNNRVILCTDGDFNVGTSSDDALERLIEEERKSGVYLTVLGFGTGNYQDAKMQKLADKGNGNHAYIDQLSEAKKVLVNEFGGTLFTIAKDVKLQVEFNPKLVKGYRLIGYENRMLAKEDFNDDRKDAGELGSGHTVTALYELVPIGVAMPEKSTVDSLRYQLNLQAISKEQVKFSDEILTIKLRYKHPDSDNSSLVSYPFKGKAIPIEKASENIRFASSVASFGMLLRNSAFKGNSNYVFLQSLAGKALGADKEGYRKEFLELVDKAASINRRKEMVLHQERVKDDIF